MQCIRIGAAIIAAAVALAVAASAAAQGRGGGPGGGGGGGPKPDKDDGPFTLIDLGTIGGEHSAALDINESGHIAGWAEDDQGITRAVLWQADISGNILRVEVLKSLAADQTCQGGALNDAGDVVGFCVTATGDFRAVLWDQINPDFPGTPPSFNLIDLKSDYELDLTVYDINNDRKIVAGYTEIVIIDGEPITVSVPVVLHNGMLTLLPEPMTYALSINAGGTVAGQSQDTSGDHVEDAVLVVNSVPTVLPKPDGGFAQALAINDDDVAAGISGISGDGSHATIWSTDGAGNYARHDIGTLGGDDSVAWDINSLNQVVGRSSTSTNTKKQSAHFVAFFWDNDVMISLGLLKRYTHLSEAYAINESSMIVGVSGNSTHETRAILWVPAQ